MDEIIDTDISFGPNTSLPTLSVLSGCIFQIFGCLTGELERNYILTFWFFWEKRFQEHLKNHLLNQMFATNWILEKYQISGIIMESLNCCKLNLRRIMDMNAVVYLYEFTPKFLKYLLSGKLFPWMP